MNTTLVFAYYLLPLKRFFWATLDPGDLREHYALEKVRVTIPDSTIRRRRGGKAATEALKGNINANICTPG
jgi:hypothetical protein